MEELNEILEMTKDKSTQKEQDEVSKQQYNKYIINKINTVCIYLGFVSCIHLYLLTVFCFISVTQILLQPFVYIQQIPGKQFRSQLSLAFNYWLHISEEKLYQIGEIVQMLHNSSLL